MKVKVSDRWAIVHDDQRHVKGDVFDAPDDIAQQWIAQGWAVEAKPAAPPRKK